MCSVQRTPELNPRKRMLLPTGMMMPAMRRNISQIAVRKPNITSSSEQIYQREHGHGDQEQQGQDGIEKHPLFALFSFKGGHEGFGLAAHGPGPFAVLAGVDLVLELLELGAQVVRLILVFTTEAQHRTQEKGLQGVGAALAGGSIRLVPKLPVA